MMETAEQQPNRTATESKEQAERVETGTHVELWMRGNSSYQVQDIQEEIYERLQNFQKAGSIASFSSHLWDPIEATPKKTSPEHTAVYRETISEFRDWANEHGYSLQPGFQIRETTGILTDQRREEIIPPILCLAVYVDGTLTTVYPYADGECIHTVTDGLTHLEMESKEGVTL